MKKKKFLGLLENQSLHIGNEFRWTTPWRFKFLTLQPIRTYLEGLEHVPLCRSLQRGVRVDCMFPDIEGLLCGAILPRHVHSRRLGIVNFLRWEHEIWHVNPGIYRMIHQEYESVPSFHISRIQSLGRDLELRSAMIKVDLLSSHTRSETNWKHQSKQKVIFDFNNGKIGQITEKLYEIYRILDYFFFWTIFSVQSCKIFIWLYANNVFYIIFF